MYKLKQTLSFALMAVSFGTLAQTPAQELVKNNPITHIERGHSIDTYGDYTVLGSNFGLGIPNGAALLFHNNNYVRTYTHTNYNDHTGHEHTLGIDQHAVVVAAPWYEVSGVQVGRVGVAPKTWDGTHYAANFSQYLYEGSGVATGFGAAVAISDNWIAVGAPFKSTDGGVRLYYRNPSTAVWEDKGWLPLPNFETAYHRYAYNGVVKNNASFGSKVSILHSNLIVAAPGIGNFYIYKLNGTTWTYSYQYTGTKLLTGPVAISDEYAVIGTGNLEVEVFKMDWGTSPWIHYQTISVDNSPATSVATEGTRLIIGQGNYNNNFGRVSYYEPTSYNSGNNVWVYNFLRKGRMFVSTSASPNGLVHHQQLGKSVAISGNKVVAGAPNAKYIGSADGAGFRADFSQMLTVAQGGRAEEIEAQAGQMGLYPNPATDKVYVSGKEVVSATATNALGATFNLSVNGAQIDISGLASGIYVLKVETPDGAATQYLSVK